MMTRPTVTEQTDKKWKAYQAGGCTITAIGIAGGFALGELNLMLAQFCFVFGAIGIVAFFTGRIGAWWYHG